MPARFAQVDWVRLRMGLWLHRLTLYKSPACQVGTLPRQLQQQLLLPEQERLPLIGRLANQQVMCSFTCPS